MRFCFFIVIFLFCPFVLQTQGLPQTCDEGFVIYRSLTSEQHDCPEGEALQALSFLRQIAYGNAERLCREQALHMAVDQCDYAQSVFPGDPDEFDYESCLEDEFKNFFYDIFTFRFSLVNNTSNLNCALASISRGFRDRQLDNDSDGTSGGDIRGLTRGDDQGVVPSHDSLLDLETIKGLLIPSNSSETPPHLGDHTNPKNPAHYFNDDNRMDKTKENSKKD